MSLPAPEPEKIFSPIAQIRNLLDPVPPSTLFPVMSGIGNMLFEHGYLDGYRSIGNTFLVALDGTDFFSSKAISCPCCTKSELKNGGTLYRHIAVVPVIVAPGHEKVIPLPPGSLSRKTATTNRIASSLPPGAGWHSGARIMRHGA